LRLRILAIASAKLGYAPIEAFDFDADAVRVARENAAMNDVKLNIARRDLTKLPDRSSRTFDVVCANLTYDLLISERDKLLNRLAPAGTIVVAGILRTQFPRVKRAFNDAGMRLISSAIEGEWKSGAFRKRMVKKSEPTG
jgi:ribosomal protein L11 methyltransferase